LFSALQLADKYRVTTPVNWKQGEDVIVHASVTQDEAKQLFPEHTVHLVSLAQSERRVCRS
jgi:C-terminal domain of 1-Cys peroxiredoxin